MKITITGASGFVGKNLSSFLKKNGEQVQALSLWQDWVYPKNAEIVIHLAGKAHDTSNAIEEKDYFTVNRDLTIKLFNQFLDSESKDFFYFSSVKAAADTLQVILDETIKPDPKTPYGKSKLEAEIFLLSQNLPIGKRLFIIRPCMIHGSGNKGNLNLLFKVVHKGIPWPLAAFDNQRSFLSMDNLNFLILKIIKNSNIPSGVYNFSDDKSLSTNELVNLITETFSKKARLWKINSRLISGLAKIGDVLQLPLNSERLKKLTESYIVSNEKIKRELNIKKLPFTAEEGLKKTIESFKK